MPPFRVEADMTTSRTFIVTALSPALLISLVVAAPPPELKPSKSAPATLPATQPAYLGLPSDVEQLARLQREILGAWRGGPCVGDYHFKADGTFTLTHFTPGNNQVTGSWRLLWDDSRQRWSLLTKPPISAGAIPRARSITTSGNPSA